MIIEKYNEQNIFVKNILYPYFLKFYKLIDAYYDNLITEMESLNYSTKSHSLGIELV